MFVPLYKLYNTKKMYYTFEFPILIVQGLILTYTFQFRSIYLNDPFNNFIFYVSLISLIILVKVGPAVGLAPPGDGAANSIDILANLIFNNANIP